MGLLKSIALTLYHPRRPSEAPTRVSKSVFWVPFTLIALAFILQMSVAIYRWSRYSPKVRIEPSQWRVLYEDAEKDCSLDEAVDSDCPAHQANSELWGSSLHPRTSEGNDAIQNHPSQRFWLGAEISAHKVQEAVSAGADILLLGWLKGDYQIWVNGHYFFHGDASDLDPIAVTLPHSAFLHSGPMSIAIRVAPKYGAYDPVKFAGDMPVGLSDPTNANAYRSFFSFGKKVRPFAIFVLFFLVSITFYKLWVSNRKKAEYFHFSMYNLVSALGALASSDLFLQILPLKISSRFILGLSLFQGILGAVLGFVFARSRPHYTRVLIAIGGMGALIASALSFSSHPLVKPEFAEVAWIGAFLHVLGASACFIQAAYLRGLQKFGIDHSSRIRKLLIFGSGLVLVSAFSIAGTVSYTTAMIFSDFLQVALIAILGGVVLFEYQRDRELIEKIPVSQYHRLPELPQCLSGVVLLVDLKDSESLTHFSLSQGRSSNDLVSQCLSRIWEEIVQAKGTILATEGDMVSAFFDANHFENAHETALRATDRIKAALSGLHLGLMEQGLLPEGYGELNFRGAIASGDIRPVWLETGVTRMAAWEQVGSSAPFLRAARYLELEREASEGKAISLVITAESVQAEAEATKTILSGEFSFSNRSLTGKHGVTYRVSGYRPGCSKVVSSAAA
jgi:hypothetical protein